jgi:hypothetical protein
MTRSDIFVSWTNVSLILLTLVCMPLFGHSGLFLAVSLTFLFLLNRDKRLLHPTNMLFAFYALYIVVPVSLYYLLEFIHWDYILPWGKVSDWSKVTYNSMYLVFLNFCMLFFTMKYFSIKETEQIATSKVMGNYIPLYICIILLIINIVGLLVFMNLTGGLSTWVNDYSNTYISGKTGVGWLNFILINLAHFTFFVCGFTYFSAYSLSKNQKTLFLILLVITFVMVCYFQGIKSRVPLLAIMFFFPLLITFKLKFTKGLLYFIGFILFFMISMYFRSNGFYESFPMLLEYLLSYFNTYILLDNTMKDFPPDFLRTIWFSSTKFTSIIDLTAKAEYLDISYWLTDVYYPEMWANNATQQWPLEMELYFNFGGLQFFLIPILCLSLYYAFLFNKTNQGNYCVYFIFIAEFVRLFSMLRGSMFPWTLPLILMFYVATYFFMKMAVKRVNK